MNPTAAFLGTLAAALTPIVAAQEVASASPGAGAPEAVRLPMAFVENAGQWDTPARFVAAGGDTVIRLEQGGFVVDATPREGGRQLLRFVFEGANTGVLPAGEGELSGMRSYFLGSDPERWRSGVRGYARVVYPNLYDGVDLCLREAEGRLEYDLRLDPGADVSAVVVRCDAVEALAVDEDGGLTMHTDDGVLRQSSPVTWCVLPSGELQPLECSFVVLGTDRFGFRLAGHDPGLPVVIDPGLEWATFLGGSGTDTPGDMALCPNGDIVVVGGTRSLDFPTGTTGATWGPLGGSDVSVSILDPTGSTLEASAVFGGSVDDGAVGVKCNSAGEVFLVGWSQSGDFPVTANALSPALQGGADAIVVWLSPDLSALNYSSYLGGSLGELGIDLHVSDPNTLTIAGSTRSLDFPITAGAVQATHGGLGSTDVFLLRMDPSLPPASQVLYGTYLGGSAFETETSSSTVFGLHSVYLHEDAAGVITVAGRTASADFPTTPGAYDTVYDGQWDVFLSRVDPSLGSGGLLYSTYINGSFGLSDGANGMAVDAAGVVTLGGFTYSPDFPTTPGAYETAFLGPGSRNDAFLLRLDPDPTISPPANQLLYSTFLTGDGFESVFDLVIDSGGGIIAHGFTGADGLVSNSFPTTCGAFQPGFAGERDGFLVHLDPKGNGLSDLLYSTYIGGAGWDVLGGAIALVSETPNPRVVSSGASSSSDFPTTAGAYQENLAGTVADNVVLTFELASSCPVTYCTAKASSAGCVTAIGTIPAQTIPVSGAGGTFVIATNVHSFKNGLVFAGINGPGNFPFGGGILCVSPPLKRGPVGFSGGTGPNLCNGGFATEVNDGVIVPAGLDAGSGNTGWYQYWYRDPANGSGSFGTALSDAIRIDFQ